MQRAHPSQDHSRALQACIMGPPDDWRRRIGRPRQSWLRTVEADLQPMNLGLATSKRHVQDRSRWRKLVTMARLRWAPEEEEEEEEEIRVDDDDEFCTTQWRKMIQSNLTGGVKFIYFICRWQDLLSVGWRAWRCYGGGEIHNSGRWARSADAATASVKDKDQPTAQVECKPGLFELRRVELLVKLHLRATGYHLLFCFHLAAA